METLVSLNSRKRQTTGMPDAAKQQPRLLPTLLKMVSRRCTLANAARMQQVPNAAEGNYFHCAGCMRCQVSDHPYLSQLLKMQIK